MGKDKQEPRESPQRKEREIREYIRESHIPRDYNEEISKNNAIRDTLPPPPPDDDA